MAASPKRGHSRYPFGLLTIVLNLSQLPFLFSLQKNGYPTTTEIRLVRLYGWMSLPLPHQSIGSKSRNGHHLLPYRGVSFHSYTVADGLAVVKCRLTEENYGAARTSAASTICTI